MKKTNRSKILKISSVSKTIRAMNLPRQNITKIRMQDQNDAGISVNGGSASVNGRGVQWIFIPVPFNHAAGFSVGWGLQNFAARKAKRPSNNP